MHSQLDYGPNRQRNFLVMALLTLLICNPVMTVYAGPLIVNGSFENGMTPWWGPGGKIVQESVAKGQSALRIAGGYIVQEKLSIQGGQLYRVNMKIKSENASEGSIFVQLSYRGTGVDAGWRGPELVNFDTRSEPALIVTGGNHEWKLYSIVLETPANANQAILYLRKKGDTPGFAFYDDVEIVPTLDQLTTATEVKWQAVSARLLAPAVSETVSTKEIDQLVGLGKQSSPVALTLAKNGLAGYHIYVGSSADLITLNAAGELAAYLTQISGGEFAPLAHDANPQSGPLIVVGRDNLLIKRLSHKIPYEKLGSDGFVIQTVGPHIIIAGNTSRGTMYGVNWFLDRKLGVKWLSPGYTHIPFAKTLQIAPINEKQVPRFAYRDILSYEGSEKVYRAHNLINGESHGPSFSPTPPEIDSWEHYWMAKGGDANFWQLLPQNRYVKEHADWYAGAQVAMMNPEIRRIMADAIIDRLKHHPNYKKIWFDIHDMDWGWDMDKASKAFADQHGGQPSAPRLDMVVDLANRVRKVLPNAKFAFNAYNWSFTPPEGMIVPDYILVFPMTIQVDYSTPLNLGRNEKMGKDITKWNAIAKNVLVWDHITNFSGYFQPTPNIYPIGHSIQWLATLKNVIGYFAEGSWNTPSAEFSSLRAWMISRLLWDPNENVESLVAQYCKYFFGDAGPYVFKYINLMHSAISQSGDVLSEKTQVDVAMLNLGFVRSADELFQKAEAAVSDDPVMLAHVKEARIPIDYVILVRRKEYEDAAISQGIDWQSDYANRLIRFNQNVKAAKVKSFRQGGGMKELAELLAVERHTPKAPEMVLSLPRTDWVDFQDLSFNLYDSAKIVQDLVASDGAGIRMNGNSPTWAVQFKMDKLPKEGRWELYADIRIEAEVGHDKDVGVKVGHYPPMGLFTPEVIGNLDDGSYHLIKIPGGAFRYNTEHAQGIYVQSPSAKYLKYIYVDRFIAVRVKN